MNLTKIKPRKPLDKQGFNRFDITTGLTQKTCQEEDSNCHQLPAKQRLEIIGFDEALLVAPSSTSPSRRGESKRSSSQGGSLA